MGDRAAFRVVGRFGLERVDRLTGEIERFPFGQNAISAFGFTDLLELAIGEHSNRYGAPNFRLHSSADAGGSVLFTTSTQVATFPKKDGSGVGYAQKIIWKWEDVSVNEYDPRSVSFRRGTSSNFSVLNINGGGGQPEWGAKTDRYNWIFYYELSFGGSVSIFGDGGSWYGGLNTIAETFSGIDYSVNFSAVGLVTSPSSGPDKTTLYPHTISVTDSTASFEIEAGLLEANFEWYHRRISIAGGETAGDTLRLVSDNALGTKASNQVWHYTYELSAS
jgi:hypothetical protein